MDANSRKRRRLRVSLRALMLAVLVAGVWMGRQVNRARQQREAVAAVSKCEGRVFYDWQFADGKLEPATEPPAPLWLRRLVGDEYFQEVDQVNFTCHDRVLDAQEVLARLTSQTGIRRLYFQGTPATDEGLRSIAHLSRLEELILEDSSLLSDDGLDHLTSLRNLTFLCVSGPRLTDAGLSHLAKLPNLERLDVRYYNVSDAGLAHLARATNLRVLFLGNGPLTDAGMLHVKDMKNLEAIDLMFTDVTDEGLEHLKGHAKLKEICVPRSRVRSEGLARFKAAMPGLIIW